jgi:hypothetical protein
MMVGKDDLAERSQRFYEEKLRQKLELEHRGQYIAVEPESGRYFLDDTGTGALTMALAEMPEGLFYLMRVGYQTADSIGGSGMRSKQ